jgi:hypothetical protein
MTISHIGALACRSTHHIRRHRAGLSSTCQQNRGWSTVPKASLAPSAMVGTTGVLAMVGIKRQQSLSWPLMRVTTASSSSGRQRVASSKVVVPFQSSPSHTELQRLAGPQYQHRMWQRLHSISKYIKRAEATADEFRLEICDGDMLEIGFDIVRAYFHDCARFDNKLHVILVTNSK